MDLITLAMAKAYSNSKGGYTKTSAPVVVIPKGSYEFNNGECITPTTQVPNEGDLITLTLDGAVYIETAKKGVVDGSEVLRIGNDASFGGDDTGENYSVVFALSEGFVAVAYMDELGGGKITTHTVELSFKTQTFVPIDPKYLPKGGVGYSKAETIFPLTEISFNDDGAYNFDKAPFALTTGNEYTVTYNGVEYKRVAFDLALFGITGVAVGNIALADFEEFDTGEPFVIAYVDGSMLFVSVDTTATISVAYETIVPIDPKYLPEGGFGYSETKKIVLAPPTVAVWGEEGYFFPCSEVTSGMVLDITIDGVTYRGTVTANENYGGMPAVVFGIVEFVYFPDMAMGNVYINDASENMPDATISVVAVDETIVPIDPKYLPEGGVGYAEQNVFTFDGIPKSGFIFGYYTKISNKTPDVDTLVSVSGFMGGQPLELSAADCQVYKDNAMSQIAFGGRAIAIVVHKAFSEAIVGLYVICETESNSYVSRIEFAETIHPIDTKYLPDTVATKADIFGAMEASY